MNNDTTDIELHRRHLLGLGAAAAIGLGSMTVAADEHDEEAEDSIETNGLFLAAMTTDQQPDEVDTAATGGAVFSLSEDGSELEYALLVSAIEDTNQAHIHLGPAGDTGPIAVWLYPGPDAEEPELQEGRFDGILSTGTITDEHLTEEVEGQTVDALVREIENGNAYVNTHTEKHPGGEIRGQVEMVEDVVSALVDDDEFDEAPDVDDEPAAEFVDEVDEQVTLSYGETARVSNGIVVTLHEPILYDRMGDHVPEARDRFLVVPVEAVNTSDEPRTLPDSTDLWDVLFGDQQLGNVFNSSALRAEGYDGLDGGEVQGGVRREGVLLFEVDEGFEIAEIDVLWQDEFWIAGDLDGDIDVRWSADG